MTHDGPTRRGFLVGAAGLAGTTSLAGCGTLSGSLEPQLPPQTLQEGGWQLVTEIEEQVQEAVEIAGSEQTVRVTAKGEAYRNDEAVTELSDKYDVDTERTSLPTTGFIAAKARIEPQLARLLALSDTVRDLAVDRAEQRAKRELRERGFRNIHKVEDGELEIAAGPTADRRIYRGDYPYESFEISVRGQPVTVEPGSVAVEAQLAVWPYRGLLTTGAGVYPAESGTLTARVAGVTRQVSLEFDPASYRESVRGLITQIS